MFKLTNFCFPIVLTAFLAGCGSSAPLLPDESTPPAVLYASAKAALQDGAYEDAIKKYELLESRFPYGSYGQQAQLDIAYALFRLPDHAGSIAACNRFIKQYPNHPNVDYAYYLKGLANYNSEAGSLLSVINEDLAERDQKAARIAFDTFRELVTRFPESRYAADAQDKMAHLLDAMARHEVIVARYYLKRRAPLAAVNRAAHVVKAFPQSASLEEALKIMVTGYDQLGMISLRDDASRVLQKSFPGSPPQMFGRGSGF